MNLKEVRELNNGDIKMQNFKAGDLISWEYTHHFNSKSRA